jgi:hypothetical protein
MDEKQEKLVLKIYNYARRKLLYKSAGGFFILLLLLSAAWLSLTLADYTFYFSRITRIGFWIINFFLFSYLFNKYLLKNISALIRLNRNMDFTDTALEIGVLFPEIKDELANSYNLMAKDEGLNVSRELIRAAVMRTLERFSDVEFKNKIKFEDYLPKRALYLPVIFGTVILLVFKSDVILHSSKRLLNPFNDYLKIPYYQFDVYPGDIELIKGSTIDLKIRYSGPEISGGKVIFNGDKRKILELSMENMLLSGKISAVKESFEYQILATPLNLRKYGDKIVSPIYKVKVLIPPAVEKIDISVTPPAYTKLPKEYLNRNIGDITALPGSIVNIKLSANKLLKNTELKFHSGENISLKLKGNSAGGSFRIKGDDRYKIVLRDTSNQENINPIVYRIQTIMDNTPFVDIFQPGEDVEVTLDVVLPLKIKTEDDFGITKAYLVYQILHMDTTNIEQEKKIELQLANTENRQQIDYLWDFNELPLAFGESIKYYAVVYDNNNINGPGIGKSKVYYVRFPSVDDLFNAFNEKENKNIDDIKDVREQSADLKKKLEEIEREIKKSRKLDWQTKQKIEQSLEQQKSLQKKVDEVQKEIEKMVEKLDKNNLISEEVLEKYMKLQEMFKNVATPELLQAMKELQKQMDKNNPKDVEKAFEKFKLNQEAFKESIERTMELLKQVQLEQQMDRLVQKSKMLNEQQKKISQKLEEQSITDKERNNLQNMQKQQESNLQSLQRDLDNLMKNPQIPKYEETEKILDNVKMELQQGEVQKNSKNVEQNIAENNQSEAKKKSKKLQNQMQNMQNKLREAQKKMGEQSKSEVQKEMLSIMKQLLELSKEQEKLYKETKHSSDYSIRQRQLAEKQSEILNNFKRTTSDIVKLSKKTFFMDKNIGRSLASAQSGMQKSLNGLTERGQGSQAASNQQSAMAGLNDSFMKMQSSMGKLSKSSSGTGFEEFMKQLGEMAGKQRGINEQSLNLMQGGKGGNLPSQQQMARRLAQEQRAVQEALEKMAEEMGNRKDMLGRIGDAAGDMEEVIKDLIKNNVNPKTIERQRQILSRLLDAQKSAQQREYSKKRKAETAKKYSIQDPGTIKNQYDIDKKYLEDALNRALKEGYNPDYKRLIEIYFKTLENSE